MYFFQCFQHHPVREADANLNQSTPFPQNFQESLDHLRVKMFAALLLKIGKRFFF